MRQIAVVGLLCCFAFGVGAQPIPEPAGDTTSEQSGAPAREQIPASKDQAAPQIPVVVNVLPPPKTEADTEQERHERAEKAEMDRRLVELTGDLATFTKWLAFATFALVVATVGLVVMGIKQARDMKESLRIADESSRSALIAAEAAREQAEGVKSSNALTTDLVFHAERSTEAAQTSARFAEETAAIMANTAERQLRAYIAVEPKSVDFNVIEGDLCSVAVSYDLVNFGQTPAYKAKTDTAFRMLAFPLLNTEISDPARNAIPLEINIAPRQRSHGVADKPVKIRPFEMREKGQRLYFVMLVSYNDAFGRPRRTEVCGSIAGVEEALHLYRTTGKSTPSMNFVWAEKYINAT